MKIYQMQNNNDRRDERNGFPVKVYELKKAAGGEDIVSLSTEAINSFNKDNVVKIREEELKKLALRHINDRNPELEGLENDLEFMKAEKLSLLAELVIRVAPAGARRNIYGRVTGFVLDQLSDRS